MGTLTVVDTGVYNLGPFPNGAPVTIDLVNTDPNICDLSLGSFVDTTMCPTIITCGTPNNFTHCYQNNSETEWNFTSSDSTSPLQIEFNFGTTENNYDELIIYDGVDDLAPILYYGYGSEGDLAGYKISSTGSDVYMQHIPDFKIDCDHESQISWDFDVKCVDCTLSNVDATAKILEDCFDGFFVEIDLVDMGGVSSIDVINNANSNSLTVLDTGIYTVGPFLNGTSVSIDLVLNNTNDLCDFWLGSFVDTTLCPYMVDCDTASNFLYCYENFIEKKWLFKSLNGASPLQLMFNSGEIQTSLDELIIYDGVDENAPMLYNHTENGVESNLLGLTVISTGQDMLVVCIPNSFIDCQDGYLDLWNFDVMCSPCNEPNALMVSNETDNSADVSWTAGGTETEWEIEYGLTGFTLGAGMTMVTTSNPTTISGLDEDAEYEFYVSSICGVGDTSGYSLVDTITTMYLCDDVSAVGVANITASSMDVSWTDNAGASAWEIEYVANGGAQGSGTVVSATSNLFTVTGLMAETSYEVYVRSICGAGDESAWIGGAGTGFMTGESCPDPTNLTTTNIASNSADFGWTENGTATAWSIEYGPVGFTQGTGTVVGASSNPFSVSGLTAGTTYSFVVKSLCIAGTDESNFSAASVGFSTLGTDIVSLGNGQSVNLYSYDNNIVLSFDNVIAPTANVVVYDILGQMVANESMATVGTQKIELNTDFFGTYFIEVVIDRLISKTHIMLFPQ